MQYQKVANLLEAHQINHLNLEQEIRLKYMMT